MPESIISASGTQYGVAVDEHNRMFVVGSITDMPGYAGSQVWVMGIAGSIHIGSVSANVDSIYVQSGDNINITGMPKTEVYGSGTFVGSITSMPSVTTGSEQWIQNFGVLGSNRVVTNLYAGSKAWIIDTIPTNADRNNEAYKFEYDAQNNLGSIVEYVGAGSYVSRFIWAGYSGTTIGVGSRVTNIGSWI